MLITFNSDLKMEGLPFYFSFNKNSIMTKLALICGGFSSEYDISVKSATNIKANFPDAYEVYLVYMTKSGWYVEIEGIRYEVDPSDFTFRSDEMVVKFDMALVYIHGDPGENGKVQAYLEMMGIPYVNSGPLASQLSFDKWFCNQFLKGFGINVADSIYLSDEKMAIEPKAIVDRLGLPVFVKPCDSGSSFGIARCDEQNEISAAIEGAFQEGKTVVIEKFLSGTEVTCGVYRTSTGVIALPLTEIVSKNKFFDFAAKYQGLSDEITPARIDELSTDKTQAIAKKVYEILQLRSIARIDFMLVDGEPFVIEVNTTPGFSNESIVPKMIKTAGKTVKEFWSEIMEAETTA